MVTLLSAWADRLMTVGTEPGDDDQIRLHKALLTLTVCLIAPTAVVWALVYWLLGLHVSAAIPFGYAMISFVSLLVFARTKRFVLFRTTQLILILLLPPLLQWSLGGFVVSSGVVLWAFLAPLGALLFHSARGAIPWFGAFAGLLAISGMLEAAGLLEAAPMPTVVQIAFAVMNVLGVTGITFVTAQYFVRGLEQQRALSDKLLLNVLPRAIADRLKRAPRAIADGHPEATILFADVVDFTTLSSGMPPAEVVGLLNDLFSAFDGLVDAHGLEKIKTIGDAYMAVGGLPTPRPDHAEIVAELALAMRAEVMRRRSPFGAPLQMRIGINSGPVVAGVIGTRKFIYDLWGDAVNTASRMESHGVPDGIQVTESTYQRLRGRYRFEDRGTIEVKGKGAMRAYLLIDRLPDEAVRSAAPVGSR